jgi:SpoVK/Ycf46/Vps4 family AAA+-type ATPase
MGEESEKFMIRSERNKRELVPKSIPSVALFYNYEESRQLKTLEGLLDVAKFSEMSKRMRDMKMKAGFTVLLYGNPGTGKTESVYQLARLTGRSIIPIEISQTKSMWFGESEKLIRDVFQSYKKLNESSKTSPILLFNEADGIFGKRTTHMDSAVSQTLNAMQNIILQEMEDFEGIMMATTNLTDNLDKAFDRRFLYKIKFENPTFDTRIEIMRDKFPFLKLEAVRQLCEHFSLTGGQMANIAKKCSIHELLNGQLPELDEIAAFCRDEQGLSEKKKLGF